MLTQVITTKATYRVAAVHVTKSTLKIRTNAFLVRSGLPSKPQTRTDVVTHPPMIALLLQAELRRSFRSAAFSIA
jgi:hypothetical protein